MVHKHGCYERYADPAGAKKQEDLESIQRYLCFPCGLTFSVLAPHRLPYRPVRAERLQGDFDQRAGIQTQGLDPPPRAVEAGCLQRAWSALSARVAALKDAFGQLVDSTVSDGLSLWRTLRQSFDSVSKMLCFLSQHHRIRWSEYGWPTTPVGNSGVAGGPAIAHLRVRRQSAYGYACNHFCEDR